MPVNFEQNENQGLDIRPTLILDVGVSKRKNFHFLESYEGDTLFVSGKVSEIFQYLISEEIGNILLKIDGEERVLEVIIQPNNRRFPLWPEQQLHSLDSKRKEQ